MTSTTASREDYPSPKPFPSFDELAQCEVIRLEEITGGSTLPLTYVMARGLSALTYAVLALRETADSNSTDLNNVLSELAGHVSDAGPELASLAENTADIGETLASACAQPAPRRFRPFSRRAES
jgi:hypothetical protein